MPSGDGDLFGDPVPLREPVIIIILWEVHRWTVDIEHQRCTSQSKCPVDNLQFMYLMRTSSKLGNLVLFVTKFKCKQDKIQIQ